MILDFIANYEKNYLIPVALSGDNSYDKDSMRKLVMLGTKVIPGASTVEFEKVVRDRVLESIDNARTNTVELLRTSYQAIKNKLGRIPNLVDFYPHNGIDAVKFLRKMGALRFLLLWFLSEVRKRLHRQTVSSASQNAQLSFWTIRER